MAAALAPSRVSLLLARMPRPLVAALDAWSYRLARRRAEQRRARVLQRANRPPT